MFNKSRIVFFWGSPQRRSHAPQRAQHLSLETGSPGRDTAQREKHWLLKVDSSDRETTQREKHRFLKMSFPDRETTEREKDRFLKMSSPAGRLHSKELMETHNKISNVNQTFYKCITNTCIKNVSNH